MCIGRWMVAVCLILSSSPPTPFRASYVVDAWRHNHSCYGCAEARDEFAKLRLEQIKKEILEKLGLESPPRVRIGDGFPIIPQVERYQRNIAPRDSSFLADEPYFSEQRTEKTILIAERPPAIFNPAWPVGYFRFSRALKAKSLRSAVLNVYIRKPTVFHFDSRLVTIQVVVKEFLTNGKFGVDLAERKRNFDLGREDYVRVNLRVDDIQRWWDDEAGKYGFLGLHVEALYKGENLAVHPQQHSKHQMNLELTTVDEWGRSKREVQNVCTKEMNEPSCCLYSLVVDFEAAGWDFVLAPRVYDAHMCSGECRMNNVGRSAHSKITSSTSRSMVSGCCHPTEYDPVTLVYTTQQNELRIKDVPGMIARRCACA